LIAPIIIEDMLKKGKRMDKHIKKMNILEEVLYIVN